MQTSKIEKKNNRLASTVFSKFLSHLRFHITNQQRSSNKTPSNATALGKIKIRRLSIELRNNAGG